MLAMAWMDLRLCMDSYKATKRGEPLHFKSNHSSINDSISIIKINIPQVLQMFAYLVELQRIPIVQTRHRFLQLTQGIHEEIWKR